MIGSFGSIALRMFTAELERRQKLAEKLREAITSAFQTAPGPEYCVRRLDVVEHVADVLGYRVINNRLFHDVERAAAELGWQSVKNGGRSLFRCAKRRDQDDDEALVISRANRYDPRTDRGAALFREDPAYLTG